MTNNLSLPPEFDSLLQKLIEFSQSSACMARDTVGTNGAKPSGIIIGGTQGDRVEAANAVGTTGLNSPGIIVGGTQGGGYHQVIGSSGDPRPAGTARVIGKTDPADARFESKDQGKQLEARYAYYRRCQHVRKNGSRASSLPAPAWDWAIPTRFSGPSGRCAQRYPPAASAKKPGAG